MSVTKKTQWSEVIVGMVTVSALTLSGCSTMGGRQTDRKIASAMVAANDNQIDEIQAASVKSTDSEHVIAAKNWVIDVDPEKGFVTSLDEFEKYKLQKGAPKVKPWGGSYWPDRIGGIGGRYHDIEYVLAIMRGDPNKNINRFERWNGNLGGKHFSQLTKEDVKYLSAAEKYDVLMGDEEFTLTHEVFRGIREQFERVNTLAPTKLRDWSGICNGWSPASILVDRPRHTVTAKSPTGVEVTFFPDDLKALASILYAHSFITTTTTYKDGKNPDVAMYGLRCDTKKPRRRAGTVEYLTEGNFTSAANECTDDVNAGAWHLSILNRMGIQGKSFVFDSNYDQSVDNHPITEYEYVYYNPVSGKTSDMKGALVPVDHYRSDPFKAKRNPATAFVVGVKMEVTYLAGNRPYYKNWRTDLVEMPLRTVDSEDEDKNKVMQLRYDLELDRDLKVVSGQWRINKKQKSGGVRELFQSPSYPDFMWYFRPHITDVTDPDKGEIWNANEKMRSDWVADSRKAAKVRSMYGTLDDRANDPRLKDEAIRRAAKKASKDYDVACRKHCGAAYGTTSTPAEKAAALAIMEPLDAALTKYNTILDDMKIPRDYPFAQPLSRVVYGLFEKASKGTGNK